MYDNDEDHEDLFGDYEEPAQQPNNGNGQQNKQGYNNNSNNYSHQSQSGGGNGNDYGNRSGGQSGGYNNNGNNSYSNGNSGYQQKQGGYQNNNSNGNGYQKNNYGNNNSNSNNYNKGGYNKGGYGGGGGYNKGGQGKQPFDREKWIAEQNKIEDPYLPVVVYFNWDADDQTIERLIGIADKLLNRGFTVRFNADNPAIHQKLLSLSKNKTEDYAPLQNWEGMEIRFYKSSKTAENMAKMYSPRWDNDKPKAKMSMTRNVSLLFGTRDLKTKSRAIALILATPDGAQHKDEVNAGTGYNAKYITLASAQKFQVMNINNQNFDNQLNQLLS